MADETLDEVELKSETGSGVEFILTITDDRGERVPLRDSEPQILFSFLQRTLSPESGHFTFLDDFQAKFRMTGTEINSLKIRSAKGVLSYLETATERVSVARVRLTVV